MGQVINRKLGLWRVFKWFFNFKASFDANQMVFGPGIYTTEIDLDDTPKKIWLFVNEENLAISVCQATSNLVGAKIIPNGFVLSVNISSNSALIEWFVEY